MTERYSFRAENNSNWKVFIDAFQEYYHVPPLHTHQLGPTPEAQNPEYEFEAAHYQLDGPHRMVSTSGTHKHNWPAEHLYPSEALTRSGNTGPWDAPDLGETLPGVNPSGIARWGIDNFQIFPNLEILIYERGWYVTLPLLADVAQHARVRGRPLLRARAERAGAPGARVRRAHVQGVRAAGLRHARRHADGARAGCVPRRSR